jgi:hypothetical protein
LRGGQVGRKEIGWWSSHSWAEQSGRGRVAAGIVAVKSLTGHSAEESIRAKHGVPAKSLTATAVFVDKLGSGLEAGEEV